MLEKNSPLRGQTFPFDNILRIKMTSTFEREQRRQWDLLASAETDREKGDNFQCELIQVMNERIIEKF